MSDNSRKSILFVCYGNMIRSQIAEGFARAIGGDALDVYSAGIHPAGAVSEEAVAAMDERGIDIRAHRSKGLDEVPLEAMDVVVCMTGHPARSLCPPSFSGQAIDWRIDDPLGRPAGFFEGTRDVIEEKVRRLVERVLAGGTPGKGK